MGSTVALLHQEAGALQPRQPFAAPTLHGPLVSLREWRPSDAAALQPACGDPLICRFTTVPRHYSRAAALRWIERQARGMRTGWSLAVAVVPAASSTPVGTVWLFDFSDRDPPGPRLGAWMMAGYRGHGLMYAALDLLSSWAFAELGLEAIYFNIAAQNRASLGAVSKLGAVRHSPGLAWSTIADVAFELHVLRGEGFRSGALCES